MSKIYFRNLVTKKTKLITSGYSRSLLSLLSMLSEFAPSWCNNGSPLLNVSDSIYFTESNCPAIKLLKDAAPQIKEDDWSADLAYIKGIFQVPNSTDDNWTTKKNPESVADFVSTNYCQSNALPKVNTINIFRK